MSKITREEKTIIGQMQEKTQALFAPIKKINKRLAEKIPFYRFFRTIIITTILGILSLVWIHFQLLARDKKATVYFDIGSIIYNTFLWGTLFLALGIGLTYTYKLIGFPNFAHGEYLIVGAYTVIFLQTLDFIRPTARTIDKQINYSVLVIGMISGFIIGALVAIVTDFLVFKPLRKKNATPQTLMIASLGVAFFIRGLVILRFGSKAKRFYPDYDLSLKNIDLVTIRVQLTLGKVFDFRYFDPSDLGIRMIGIIFIVYIIFLLVVLLLFLKYTKQGKAMRAVADNPELAAASGINVEKIYMISWIIGGGYAGTAGAVLAALINITPSIGFVYLLPAFAVIVLGSIGSLRGAFIAALIIGFARSFSIPFLAAFGTPFDRPAASQYQEIVPYVFLIIILLFFAEGIGQKLDEWQLNRLRKKFEEEEGESHE